MSYYKERLEETSKILKVLFERVCLVTTSSQNENQSLILEVKCENLVDLKEEIPAMTLEHPCQDSTARLDQCDNAVDLKEENRGKTAQLPCQESTVHLAPKRSSRKVNIKAENENSVSLKDNNKLSLFKCNKCDLKFRLQIALNKHASIHLDSDASLQCAKCGKNFLKRKIDFNKHLKKCTQENCEPRSTNSGKLVGKPLVLNTNVCNQQSSAVSVKCEQELLHECNVCFKVFRDINKYVAHTAKHTTQNSFKCSVCPKSYENQNDFLDHEKSHKKSKLVKVKLEHLNEKVGDSAQNKDKFKCTFCEKQFLYKASLMKHSKCHTN